MGRTVGIIITTAEQCTGTPETCPNVRMLRDQHGHLADDAAAYSATPTGQEAERHMICV